MSGLTWQCLGSGHGDTCDAHGNTDRGAEKHCKEAKHCTTTHLTDRPEKARKP